MRRQRLRVRKMPMTFWAVNSESLDEVLSRKSGQKVRFAAKVSLVAFIVSCLPIELFDELWLTVFKGERRICDGRASPLCNSATLQFPLFVQHSSTFLASKD